MDEETKEISVVVPVYSSELTLRQLINRLEKVLHKLVDESYEIILVNDGSIDSSWDILKEIVQTNNKIIAINLTRNFGQHNALMCGLTHAKGNYVVTLDDDLQNPPEEITKLFEEVQKGYDIVYGIFQVKHHSRFRNLGSAFVQFIYRKTFNINVPITSFRILKNDIVKSVITYDRSFTFIDGITSWFTRKIGTVIVEHHQRNEGKSGYSFMKLVTLAVNMMTNFSIVPLQIASLVGLFFAIVGFTFGSYFLFKKLLWDIPVSGFASIIVSITIFSGVQLLTIGVLGEYIGRIHININARPQYSVRDIVKYE